MTRHKQSQCRVCYTPGWKQSTTPYAKSIDIFVVYEERWGRRGRREGLGDGIVGMRWGIVVRVGGVFISRCTFFSDFRIAPRYTLPSRSPRQKDISALPQVTQTHLQHRVFYDVQE